MRVKPLSIIRALTGPYGGPEHRLRFNTDQNGDVHLVRRKSSLGAQTDSLPHLISQVHWIYTDNLWQAMTPPERAEWGRCPRRTRRIHRSALDEFRSVNMTRLYHGMPALLLPPVKGKSMRVYVDRPGNRSYKGMSPRASVWVRGEQKPDPPGTPHHGRPHVDPDTGEETEGKPFGPNEGDAPNPIWKTPDCILMHCISSVPYCSERYRATAWWPFERSEGFEHPIGIAPTIQSCAEYDPDTGDCLHWTYDRDPLWDGLSAATDEPDEGRRKAKTINWRFLRCCPGHETCMDKDWLPWWQLNLRYYRRVPSELAYATYYCDLPRGCPRGSYVLAGSTGDEFDWPGTVNVSPLDPPAEDGPCCPSADYPLTRVQRYHAMWHPLDDRHLWAGMAFKEFEDRFICHIPAWQDSHLPFDSSVPICHSTGHYQGFWTLDCYPQLRDQVWAFRYVKQCAGFRMGPAGPYFLEHGDSKPPWVPRVLYVQRGAQDWHDVRNAEYKALALDIAEFVALYLLSLAAAKLWGYAQASMKVQYIDDVAALNRKCLRISQAHARSTLANTAAPWMHPGPSDWYKLRCPNFPKAGSDLAEMFGHIRKLRADGSMPFSRQMPSWAWHLLTP